MSTSRDRRRKQQRAQGAGPPQARVKVARPAATEVAEDPAQVRRDRFWQCGLTLVAAAIYATTFSAHVALGDAPESVAGVRTLGILHAPGYPSYVLIARLFGSVVPLGTWAFRVNLFSLVCSALTVGIVFRLALRFGATRAGGAVGALALATSASFWFNAGFAKYYAFTALMLAGAALAALVWEDHGSPAALGVSGLLLGASFGSGWELAAIMIVAVAALVIAGPRVPTREALVRGVAALVITSAVGVAFLVVRGFQDPTLNWGDPTTPSRLLGLISRRDFSGTVNGTAGAVGTRFETMVVGLGRDLGLVAIVLALVGVYELYRRRIDLGRALLLGLAALLNLVGIGFGSTIKGIAGFGDVIPAGGYLLATMIVVAVLVGVGTTAFIAFAVPLITARFGSGHSGLTRALRPAIVVVVLAVVVVPSLVVHPANTNLRVPPLADRYGSRVLEALPRNAVLLVWGEEYSMPMLYRQLVDHERPDVTVISANSIGLTWARDQITSRLHLGDSLRVDREDLMLRRMIAKIRQTRPVFLDVTAMNVLAPFVPYRTEGFVGEVVDGKVGPHPVTDLAQLAAAVAKSDRVDGLDGRAYRRLVFDTIYAIHERAHLELAKAYALDHDLGAAIAQIRLANSINPVDGPTLATLAKLSPTAAQAMILTL